MVIAIIEPISAGIIVSLLNKYFISGQCYTWLQQCCEQTEELIEERNRDREHDGAQWSSTTTTVSDATIHVHSH